MNQHNIPVQRFLNMSANGSNLEESMKASYTTHNTPLDQEMEQLKLIVQRLMADNEKKKLEINTLRNQLSKGSPVGLLHQNGYVSDQNGVIGWLFHLFI